MPGDDLMASCFSNVSSVPQSPASSRESILPGDVHQSSGGVPPQRDPSGGSDAIRHGDRHPVCVHGRGGSLPGDGRGPVRGRQPASGHAPSGPLLQVGFTAIGGFYALALKVMPLFIEQQVYSLLYKTCAEVVC